MNCADSAQNPHISPEAQGTAQGMLGISLLNSELTMHFLLEAEPAAGNWQGILFPDRGTASYSYRRATMGSTRDARSAGR